jgi:F-type H+-transporting ATPase subunit delta
MASVASSRRYAQAIMELALQHGDIDAWQRDLALLQEIWADPVVRGYLEDVRISKQKRLDRARQALDTRISPLALNLVLLLLSRGRSNLLPYIARQFDDLLRARTQNLLVHVTAAQPLTEEQRSDLIAQLKQRTGKDVTLEEAVDPTIVGGLVIKIGDQLLDLSVAGTIRQLREQVVGR